MPWRLELTRALGDVRAGAHSLLELRYVRNVERAHGLPSDTRQHAAMRRGRRQYADVRYGQYATVLELDGRVGHVEFGRWRDMWRDNASAAGGDATVRYGWGDITERPCTVAAQVAQVLGARGWGGRPYPCGLQCGLAEDSGRNEVRNPP